MNEKRGSKFECTLKKATLNVLTKKKKKKKKKLNVATLKKKKKKKKKNTGNECIGKKKASLTRVRMQF